MTSPPAALTPPRGAHRRRHVSRRVERRAGRAFLPEIQALRMWAVGLVVVFHLWPTGWFPGGFVGVDAFFVISGYLITSHLIREVEATGRVRLAAFYARRARRLLPASLLVLVVSAALTRALLPQDTWADVAAEIVASAFYVQNLWLASKAVTYSASTDAPSAVQHYWSLSTEEQFYLVWPSLILLALAVSRRWHPRRPVIAIGAVLTLVALASFAFSLWYTPRDQAAAYFITPTRAWEFAAGAMLPLLLRRWAPPARFAVQLRYTGLALLVGSAAVITQQTPFPGWAATIPVLGTAMMIAAGDCEGHDRLDALFTNKVTQWLGDISYSIYLWHWPLIVAAPYLTGGTLTTRHKLTIAAATLALSHLSKTYVEDATRYLPRTRRSTTRTLLVALAGMLVATLAGAGLAGASAWADRQHRLLLEAERANPCTGGRAGFNLDKCADAFTRPPIASTGASDTHWRAIQGCTGSGMNTTCTWTESPTRTIALVGDSHAFQHRAAMEDIARRNGWRLIEIARARCPAADGAFPTFLGARRADPEECRSWVKTVAPRLREAGVSMVVTSAYATATPTSDPDPSAAYHRVWDEWASFATVLVLRDTPSTGEQDMPACVKQHGDRLSACARPRDEAVGDDQLVLAARSSHNDKVRFLDLTDSICDQKTCHAVAGGLPVFMDRNHITYSFSQSLAPLIEAALRP